MTKVKKELLLIILTVFAAMCAVFTLMLGGSFIARADGEETKQTVETETELVEKDDDNETGGYIPDPDSDKKGGTDKEKPEEKDKIIYNLPEEISETKDSAPHYHTIGQYDGYVVELKAYEFDPEYSYEYCDVFDHFFDNGTLSWTSGGIPECNGHNLAVFTCSVCNERILVCVSGEHSFADSSTEVNGFTVKVCETCGKNVCTDFYKSSTATGNWSVPEQNQNGQDPQGQSESEQSSGVLDWMSEKSDDISKWINENVGLSVSGGFITGSIIILILYFIFRRR